MRNTVQPSQLPAGLLGNETRKQARAAREVDETGGWIGVWLRMLPIALAWVAGVPPGLEAPRSSSPCARPRTGRGPSTRSA
jgi:hypothetical protein